MGQNELLLSRKPNHFRFWFSVCLIAVHKWGETHRSSLRGPLTVVSLLGWHISIMWSHYVKYPKSYMAGGYVLGIYLSYLRLGLQCGKSTGFGSQELGSSLSSAFYLCDHWKPS